MLSCTHFISKYCMFNNVKHISKKKELKKQTDYSLSLNILFMHKISDISYANTTKLMVTYDCVKIFFWTFSCDNKHMSPFSCCYKPLAFVWLFSYFFILFYFCKYKFCSSHYIKYRNVEKNFYFWGSWLG